MNFRHPLIRFVAFRHRWLAASRPWLRRLLAGRSSRGAARSLPQELAHLDDRLLRDIGFDPRSASRDAPVQPVATIERWVASTAPDGPRPILHVRASDDGSPWRDGAGGAR